jgi:predicted MPP superfamily phosphohydrolase
MRILHGADLHARWRWYDWIAARADRFDLVAIAGDLVDMIDDRNLEAHIREVSDRIRSMPGTLAICSGNHDVFLEQSVNPEVESPTCIQQLRRDRVSVDGDSFLLEHGRIEVVG